MLWLFLISIAVFTYCLVQILFNKKRLRVEKRLDEIKQDKYTAEKQSGEPKLKGRTRLDFLHISQSMKNDILLSGIKMRPEEFVLFWILIIFGPAALSITVSPSLLRAFILILVGTFAMPIYLKMAVNKRQALFERQLGDALMVISNGLRAGFSFPQALDNVAKDLADPIRAELRSVCREIQLGGGIETALTKVATRMNSGDMKLLTTSVVVQQQVGGNLAEILDTISQTIRERLSIRRSVRTLTAQGRISGKIIGFLPIALLIILSILNPTYMQPFFTTTYGHIMLFIGAVMECIGFLVIRKIVDLKF
ncbi:Bacterial type II secretion system protein F domain protein [Pelotomaculum sp. FP]|uniref:type II secretion system F family protein n=1 Tax=Pelotomaculum sp. FP TaxID=261474 RepID=UPI001065E431|nr:type II secretion system F family protein [Pelotomaculum sp. FP]TEB12138.1 Bacterial type II secretion system protein F domain protein [Pelotomaculum sp. FP]